MTELTSVFFIRYVSNCLAQQNSFHHDIFYIHDYLSLHATTLFYYYLRVFLFHARTHVLILLLSLSLWVRALW